MPREDERQVSVEVKSEDLEVEHLDMILKENKVLDDSIKSGEA